MKAILVKQPGAAKELRIEECSMPMCGANDVLVQIKVAGINFIDVYLRTGLYQPPQYPYIPGKEGSGVVVEVGDNVKDIKKGDHVAFCVGGTGTYAEYAAIPAEQVVVMPNDVSFETAAAVMLQGLTAYYLSHLTVRLTERDTVLVHAGAGGVGLLLIQMAKLLGAHVITTVSTNEKAELAKQAGADDVVQYTKQSFLDVVMKYTNGNGVQVVYDSVGKTTFNDSLKSLAVRGLLVSYGQSSGPVPPFQLTQLSEKSLFITRPSLFHYTKSRAELLSMASDLFAMINSGKLAITIGQRYALVDASRAHQDLEGRNTIGKSILMMGEMA